MVPLHVVLEATRHTIPIFFKKLMFYALLSVLTHLICPFMKADAVIIPEPFAQSIITAQLGVMWLRITVRGRPAHVLNTRYSNFV